MQLLPILIALVLGLLALAFVLYPLYRRAPGYKDDGKTGPWTNNRTDATGANSEQAESTLIEREQAARSALQEIELDYQLGNIAEPDYQTLRERYVRRALVALKSRYDREQELDEIIEIQLREMKEHKSDTEQ